MSEQITDSAGVPMSYLSFSQEESSDSAVFVIKVPCRAGQWLKAEANADVEIMAREHGTVDPYADLNTDPIDLTIYDGTNQAFDVFVRTNAVSGLVSTAVVVTATFAP